MGHYQSECPRWEEGNANYTGFDDEEEVLLMAFQDEGKETRLKETWFLDSGCNKGMVL